MGGARGRGEGSSALADATSYWMAYCQLLDGEPPRSAAVPPALPPQSLVLHHNFPSHLFSIRRGRKGPEKAEERRGQGPEMARNKFNVTEGVGAA